MIVEFEGQRFEFPDDATDQEIAAAIGGGAPAPAPADPNYIGPQQPGAAAAQPAAPTQQPQSDPLRALQVGAQGVGGGLADVAGLPVDLGSGISNVALSGADLLSGFLGGPEIDYRVSDPMLGSQWIKDMVAGAAEGAGMDVLTPDEMSPRERMMSKINELGTAAVVSGGALGAAPRSANATIAGLQKPYATSASPLIGDAAAGAGAGAATGAYKEFAPQSVQDSVWGPVLETLAATAGGIGGATLGTAAGATGGVIGNTVRNAGDALRPDAMAGRPVDTKTGAPFRRSDVDQAATYVQNVASNPSTAAANIDDAATRLAMSGSKESIPTTGLLSDDVGLAMFENAARQKNQVPFIERDQRVRTQARDLVDNAAPRGAEGRNFTDAAARAARAQEEPALREVEQLAGQRRGVEMAQRREGAAVEQYRGQKPAAAADIDRTVVDETLRPMQEASSARYRRVDPAGAAMVPSDSLIDTAAAVRATLGDLNAPGKVIPGALLRRIEATAGEPEQVVRSPILDSSGRPVQRVIPAEPSEVSVGDLVDVVPEISTTIERARRAGNFKLADNLRALRREIENTIEREAAAGNPAAQRAVDARENYRSTVGEAFGGGPGSEARRFRQDFNLDRAGRSTTPPSQTAGRFLRPGQPEKAQSLARILENAPDPQAGQVAVREYLLSDLAESGALQNGVIRPDTLRAWRDKWGSALDTAPGLRDDVAGWLKRAQKGERLQGDLAAELKAADAKLSDAKRNKGVLALVLDKDPANAVNAVFSSGDPERAMKEITDKIGRGGNRKQALDGLKAAVRDWLVERKTMSAVQNTTTGQNPVSFDQLDKLFKQHTKTLSQVFSPQEMNALRQAHAFLAPLKNRELGAATGSQTASRLADKFWRTAEIGLKAKFGILKGGGMLRTLRLWADTLPSNDEAVQQLIQQMWFDPELAQHLLTKSVKDVGTPQWNSRLNTLLGVAAGTRESLAPGVEE